MNNNKDLLSDNNDDNIIINYYPEVIDSIIKNSLEYYDYFQPEIQKIINNIEYIEFKTNSNITDELIFYDLNNNVILKSKYEILSIFNPQVNVWKWSWSLPSIKKKNSIITRKILEYAFTLDPETDYLLKSTLINSNINILNNNQLDIYLGLSAKLSKKPFIFRFYNIPHENKKDENNINDRNVSDNIYYYKKIINNPKKHNFMSIYAIILDWNSENNDILK